MAFGLYQNPRQRIEAQGGFFDLTSIPLKRSKIQLPSPSRQIELTNKLDKCRRHIERLKTSLTFRRTNKHIAYTLIEAHTEREKKLAAELAGYPLPEYFGQLYRAQMPLGIGGEETKITAAIKELKDAKITRVFLLCSDSECEDSWNAGINLRKLYTKHGIKVIHFPVKDFGAWPQDEFNKEVHKLHNLLMQGFNVAVHCKGGIGRTGTIISALASKVLNLTGDKAIEYTRKHSHPSSVETSKQRALVASFAGDKQPKVQTAPICG